MSIIISILLILAGYLYADYNYKHDNARFLKGLGGTLVLYASILIGVGIIIGSFIR